MCIRDRIREYEGDLAYLKFTQVDLPQNEEMEAVFEAVTAIVTHARTTDAILERYGMWIRQNTMSIRRINLRMRFLKKEVEGNSKKIGYLDRRMDDFKENVTRRFEKLEYRVKKIEKIGLGKFGRIMSKVGKGIEKIFGGVKGSHRYH